MCFLVLLTVDSVMDLTSGAVDYSLPESSTEDDSETTMDLSSQTNAEPSKGDVPVPDSSTSKDEETESVITNDNMLLSASVSKSPGVDVIAVSSPAVVAMPIHKSSRVDQIDFGECVGMEDFGGDFDDSDEGGVSENAEKTGVGRGPVHEKTVEKDESSATVSGKENLVDQAPLKNQPIEVTCTTHPTITKPDAEAESQVIDTSLPTSNVLEPFTKSQSSEPCPKGSDTLDLDTGGHTKEASCSPPVLEAEQQPLTHVTEAGDVPAVIDEPEPDKDLPGSEINTEEDVNEGGKESGKAEKHEVVKRSYQRRHQHTTEETFEKNADLNINSRPRRSVVRKSVFELLHVEYRATPSSGGPNTRKHAASSHQPVAGDNSASDAESDGPSPTKRRRKTKLSSARKSQRASSNGVGEVSNDNDEEHDENRRRKVVGYNPDDFNAASDSNGAALQDKSSPPVEKKTPAPTTTTKKHIITSYTASIAARVEEEHDSFAAEFERASEEELSREKPGRHESEDEDETGAGGKHDLELENSRLRARLQELEEERISDAKKKFAIDVHTRKFSRVRTSTGPNDHTRSIFKSRNIGDMSSGTPGVGAGGGGDGEEAWKSRTAMLDRREHKLRELSAELDDRSTAIQVAEGALQRRERKLTELEKTLEYRERVLSRHEQVLRPFSVCHFICPLRRKRVLYSHINTCLLGL